MHLAQNCTTFIVKAQNSWPMCRKVEFVFCFVNMVVKIDKSFRLNLVNIETSQFSITIRIEKSWAKWKQKTGRFAFAMQHQTQISVAHKLNGHKNHCTTNKSSVYFKFVQVNQVKLLHFFFYTFLLLFLLNKSPNQLNEYRWIYVIFCSTSTLVSSTSLERLPHWNSVIQFWFFHFLFSVQFKRIK